MLETTSAVRSTGNTAGWAGSTSTLAYLFIVLFLAAAAIGGGLVCIGFGWSSALQSLCRLHAAITPAHADRCPPGPSPPRHSAPERQSIVGLALPQCNASAHPEQLAYIFAVPSHARDSWCTAQNDAAGLAAERDFEAHVLEKSMLAEAKAAERALYGNPSCSLARNHSGWSRPVQPLCCPIIRSWRRWSRDSLKPRGRGEAGVPSAELTGGGLPLRRSAAALNASLLRHTTGGLDPR